MSCRNTAERSSNIAVAAAEKTERRLTLEAAVQQFGAALTAREGARMRLIKRTAVRCVFASALAEGANPAAEVEALHPLSMCGTRSRSGVGQDNDVHMRQSALVLCSADSPACLPQPPGAAVPADCGGPDEAHGARTEPERHEPLGRSARGGAPSGRRLRAKRDRRLQPALGERAKLLDRVLTMPERQPRSVTPWAQHHYTGSTSRPGSG